MVIIILSFITSFALTYVAIPSIIHLADKNLVDEPGERRSHDVGTPSLGGICHICRACFSIIMWTPFNFGDLQYILCAFIIIFLVGARTTSTPFHPQKLAGQMLAAAILVFKANVKSPAFMASLWHLRTKFAICHTEHIHHHCHHQCFQSYRWHQRTIRRHCFTYISCAWNLVFQIQRLEIAIGFLHFQVPL